MSNNKIGYKHCTTGEAMGLSPSDYDLTLSSPQKTILIDLDLSCLWIILNQF